ADAAVVHFEHILVGADDQVVVDADLAELIDDDGVTLAVVLGEDAVEQGGLACAEVAGEDGDGDLLGHGRLDGGCGAEREEVRRAACTSPFHGKAALERSKPGGRALIKHSEQPLYRI